MNKKLARSWASALSVVLGLLAPSFAIEARAEVTATVLLKTGERLQGTNLLYAVDYGQVVLRTSVAEEPRIPVDRVAVIDFVGDARNLPSAEFNRLATGGGPHLLVLRDGTMLSGSLIRASHSEQANQQSPYIITFRTDNTQEQRFELNRVSRIYLAQPPSGTTAAEVGTAGDQVVKTVTVPANTRWVDTGIIVRRGDTVKFDASGEVRLSSDPTDVATPAGSVKGRRSTRAPLRTELSGALIGRVGGSEPFGVGNQTVPLPMGAGGRLLLGINDDDLRDNSGQFTVVITAPAQHH